MKSYIENEQIIDYVDLLLKAYVLYGEYEDAAKILLADSVDKGSYSDLLLLAAKMDTLINEIVVLRDISTSNRAEKPKNYHFPSIFLN